MFIFTYKTKSMNKIIVIFIICLSFLSKAQTNNWFVKTYSINFKIKNAKLNVTGMLGGLKAKINFDPLNPMNGNFEGTIDVNTLKTGIDMRDKHLKKAEYFDVASFPEITIKSINIIKVKDNLYNAKCSLTMKGKTKEVMLPFTITANGKTAELKGTLALNRLDFGVGSSSVIMANNLEVTINVTVSHP